MADGEGEDDEEEAADVAGEDELEEEVAGEATVDALPDEVGAATVLISPCSLLSLTPPTRDDEAAGLVAAETAPGAVLLVILGLEAGLLVVGCECWLAVTIDAQPLGLAGAAVLEGPVVAGEAGTRELALVDGTVLEMEVDNAELALGVDRE